MPELPPMTTTVWPSRPWASGVRSDAVKDIGLMVAPREPPRDAAGIDATWVLPALY
jgi:hypothetical protein